MNCSSESEAIAAVVVTFESASTIDACLERLRAAHDVAEIRVVDNHSSDDTVERIRRHALADPRIHYIANPGNPGFAAACNQGAADSTASWLAFINPDLMVQPDTLQRLRALAVVNDPALLGVELLDEAGQPDPAARRRDPDFAAMLRAPGRASKLAIARDPDLQLQPVPAISGALMLLPRTLFQRLHGLDEGYRLHAEDLDFCRRARAAGACVAVANALSVLHIRGVSSRSNPLFVEWHKHRGLWRYFRKFEAKRRGWATRIAVFAMIWARFPVAVLKRF
ncbi:glycosyltransferase family 2 protein [Pseudoxanthomonas dokdonensis]|uniref:glycosyltransferase family 2 protein n=1 Tax=Pseudoxanthomonas dokdonensis TaxID=344882 RepID=UPI001FDF0C64|nr:glycosyltransferase family 2 protein [Pseudoxanthomonas dokdonensis]